MKKLIALSFVIFESCSPKINYMNIVTGETYSKYTGKNENVHRVELKKKPTKLAFNDKSIFIYKPKN